MQLKWNKQAHLVLLIHIKKTLKSGVSKSYFHIAFFIPLPNVNIFQYYTAASVLHICQFCIESDTLKQRDPPPPIDVPNECPPQHVM